MILITGGAGYIGSHIALKLLEESDRKIVIFDNLENGHMSTIKTLQSIRDFDFVKGDLKNQDDLENLFRNFDIDSVIHFAACICVEESVQNPRKYYSNNLVGTINLLNKMLDHDVKKIVFSSTAAVYGEPKYVPIDENHPKRPINAYGKTKFMAEEILDDYDKSYGLKSIRLRYFNVAGSDSKNRIGESHDPETHLIPNILASAADSENVFNLFGTDYATRDGTCIRDYVNVEDLASAHISALQYLSEKNQSDCFNIGTKNGNTVKEIFETCKKITEKEIKVKINPRRGGDPESLVANNEKAKKILNWCPKKTLEDTIKTAYAWLKK
ncbi:MAG: UDP-glucose 4-epimerase GalE [Alphaproteobacteria bacterium]|nr:UDP-glucose 4-epimerase GalE [Alphaproteobacteria bacterium]